MTAASDTGARPVRDEWLLDPSVRFLNHGSFGACPRAVLAAQQRWRERMERQPVRFLARELEGLLDEAREPLARFLGASPEDLAWVANATTGVNAVVRSLRLRPGDELIATDHTYNACRNALEHVAAAAGARVVVVPVPFPVAGPDDVVEAVLARVTPHTRIALIDHVTSPTGLVLPVARLVRELEARGVDALVDGAHAPGMVEVDLTALGAAYYTGNCHKWICAPKGAGFLHVRRDRQAGAHPAVISHGANTRRTDRSRFLIEFDWVGTLDPTPYLCVPEALRTMGALFPGGWPELRMRNRALALEARALLCDALGIPPPSPPEMIGSLAAVPLPGPAAPPAQPPHDDPLQQALIERYGIEVPIVPWPVPSGRLVRISAQAYNVREDYAALAAALRELCGIED
jgi:isopenicillin-N epimerase